MPHRRALLKVCWAYGSCSHDRDDLFQEIVGRLWAAFAKYDQCRPFSTWMYRVALNVAIDYRRRRSRRSREGSSLDEYAAVLTANTDDQPGLELRELLELQSEEDRAILLLYLENRSYREIGEVLGISESNVGTRINRLKNTIRQSFEQRLDPIGGE